MGTRQNEHGVYQGVRFDQSSIQVDTERLGFRRLGLRLRYDLWQPVSSRGASF